VPLLKQHARLGRRKAQFWDSSEVLVELVSRALENAGWRIQTASSKAEKAYPTGDGKRVFPDIAAFNGRYWLFSEVKSRLFLLRDLRREHITYHFAPAPRCRDAFSSLPARDPRDRGACEMQRLEMACSTQATSTGTRGFVSAIVPEYVAGWKLDELTICLEEMNASSSIPVELWILSGRVNGINLFKKLARQGTPDVPMIPDRIVNDVAKEFGISFQMTT